MSPGEIHTRTKLLVGEAVFDRLAHARVILFGVGGVGSWCAEGLVRSGIGHLTIVDSDCVAPSNVNRQLMATTATIGRPKVEVLRERLLEINPSAEVVALQQTYCEATADSFDLDSYDYVIDCIDALKDKILLILRATASSAAFFSSMGAALKVDPTRVRVGEFFSVRDCPLGAMLRKKIRSAARHKGTPLPAKPFLCVYDGEVLPNLGTPAAPAATVDSAAYGAAVDSVASVAVMDSAAPREDPGHGKNAVNGSLVHITAIFGFTLCGLVISDIYNSTIR